MKISSKATYALRALFDIAFHSECGSVKVAQIAERAEVPPRFLEQIFQDLKRAGIVGSKRGRYGGYFLLKRPDDIGVGDILRAVDGETDYACCFATDLEVRQRCHISSRCVTAAVWRDISIRIDSILDGVTLRDVMNKGDLIGVPRACDAKLTPTA